MGWLNRADDPGFWARTGAVCRLCLTRRLAPSWPASTRKPVSRRKPASAPRFPPAPAGTPAASRVQAARHRVRIAAANAAAGEVISQRVARNDSAAFIEFLSVLDQYTPPCPRIHLIMDNGSSRTSKATRAWIAAHLRSAVTCTPKHASRLNMVEQWFSVVAGKLLRRCDFASRDDLENQITECTVGCNETRTVQMELRREHARYLERRARQDALAQSA